VDVQRDFAADGWQIGECWDADGDVVADAASFDYRPVGVLGQQSSAEMGDHAADIVAGWSCGGIDRIIASRACGKNRGVGIVEGHGFLAVP